jgi:hypothetical protein
MTEAEWLACADPTPMLNLLRGKPRERKLRLFACACVCRAWHLLTDTGRQAVEAAEAYADGRIDGETLRAARRAAHEPIAEAIEVANLTWSLGTPLSSSDSAAAAAEETCGDMDSDHARYIALQHVTERARDALGWTRSEYAAQAALLREILGNPFQPPLPLPAAILAWNDATVVRLAQAANDERRLPEGTLDPSRLAVFADALEEAGCTSEDVLGHLRGPGPHVRGCWAVDLCLGKS